MEILIIVYENTMPLSRAIKYFNLFFMYKNITISFSLKSLCFLVEAERQYERSAVRHREDHLWVPGMYSDALAPSQAHEL